MNKILEVSHLNKKYHTLKEEIVAIEDINFSVNEGEFVAIVGSSGCGKSTLLSILTGLEKEYNGNFKYSISSPTFGYMLQEDALFDHLNILENVLLGLKVKNIINNEEKEKAISLLNNYGLGKFIYKYPKELSGGMKQRVALIRTLMLNPDVLFLDEPFSALDYSTRLQVSDDVYSIIKDSGKTTIMVTHDIGEAISMADKVITLSKSPATIKNEYVIHLDNKQNPMNNRKDVKFNYYFDKIWKDLE